MSKFTKAAMLLITLAVVAPQLTEAQMRPMPTKEQHEKAYNSDQGKALRKTGKEAGTMFGKFIAFWIDVFTHNDGEE